MPKIPECDHCSFNAHNPHIVCAVHPNGVESEKSMDFRQDSNAKKEEQWSPQGYSWFDGELIPNRPSRYTLQEQLEILDTHPLFTDVCPKCRYEFDRDNLPIHFDCPECEFVDDSV